MTPFIMYDILIMKNICFIKNLGEGWGLNFISGRGSDGLDPTLPINTV